MFKRLPYAGSNPGVGRRRISVRFAVSAPLTEGEDTPPGLTSHATPRTPANRELCTLETSGMRSRQAAECLLVLTQFAPGSWPGVASSYPPVSSNQGNSLCFCKSKRSAMTASQTDARLSFKSQSSQARSATIYAELTESIVPARESTECCGGEELVISVGPHGGFMSYT